MKRFSKTIIYSTFAKNIKVSIYCLVVHQSLQTYHSSSLTKIPFAFITFLTLRTDTIVKLSWQGHKNITIMVL